MDHIIYQSFTRIIIKGLEHSDIKIFRVEKIVLVIIIRFLYSVISLLTGNNFSFLIAVGQD